MYPWPVTGVIITVIVINMIYNISHNVQSVFVFNLWWWHYDESDVNETDEECVLKNEKKNEANIHAVQWQWPHDTLWHHKFWSTLLEVMACPLLGLKPIPQPMLDCFELGPYEEN